MGCRLDAGASETFIIGARMVKFTMSVPEAMSKALEKERDRRRLDTVQETIRPILAEYFRDK